MTTLATDNFTRTNQSGFGTASDSQVWGTATGAPVTSITSNKGRWCCQGNSSFIQIGTKTTGSINHLGRYYLEGSSDLVGAMFRSTDSSNYYVVIFNTTTLFFEKFVIGSSTQLTSSSISADTTHGWWVRVVASGTTIQARIWQDGTSEPSTWNINTTDSTYSSGGFGCFAFLNAVGADIDSLTVTDNSVIYTFTESLSPSDSLSETDAYVPTDALTLTEIPGIATWPIDTLSVSETIAYVQALVPIETPGLTESLLESDSYSVTDALPLTEMLLSSVPINSNPLTGTDILPVVESLFIAESYLPIDAISASDVTSTQTSPIETLTLIDSILKTDTTLPIDALGPTDAPLETTNGTFVETLTITDSLTYTGLTSNLMLSTDAPPLAESILETDSYNVIESLSLTETILIGVPTVNNMMTVEDDLVISDLMGSMQRGFIESLGVVESEINMASVFLGQAIAASSSVLIITGGLITNLLLLTQTATSTASYAGNIFTTLLVTSSLSAYGQVSTFATNAVATSLLANGGNSFFETDMVASTLFSPAAYTVGAFTEITALSDSMFMIRSFGPINAPTLFESMQGTEIYIPIDTTPPTTFVSGANANLTPFTEALLASESMFYSTAYMPSEGQAVASALLVISFDPWVDLLIVSDTATWSSNTPSAIITVTTTLIIRDGKGTLVGRDGKGTLVAH